MLLVPLAHALTYDVPGDYASLQDAIDAAAADGDVSTIRVASGYSAKTETSVLIGADEVVIESADGSRVALPPVAVSGGSLTVRQAQWNRVVSVSMSSWAEAVYGPSQTCAVCATSGEVILEDVVFAHSLGNGLLALDSDLAIRGGEFTGNRQGSSVVFYAPREERRADLSDVTFTGVAEALELRGGGNNAAALVTLTDVSFLYGEGTDTPDIDADNAEISGTRLTFTGSSASEGSPVDLSLASLECIDCTVSGTSGGTAGFVEATLNAGQTLAFRGGSLVASANAWYFVKLDDGGSFVLDSATVSFYEAAPSYFVYRFGGETEITATAFVGGGASAEALIFLAKSSSVLTGNAFCGLGSSADSYGLLKTYEGDLKLAYNWFQGVGGPTLIELIDGPADPDLSIAENTFVLGGGSVVRGIPGSLSFSNNIVYGAGVGLNLTSWPAGATGGYNLWHDDAALWVGEPPVGFGEGDVAGDPMFVPEFSPADCATAPYLQEGSPAIDAGNPTWTDADGSRSDIGALDYTGEADTGDTGAGGDTGDSGVVEGEDADADGVVDADDCAPADGAVYPGAVDDPGDDVDQDCDGVAAGYLYGGGCGCGGGGVVGAWTLAGLLLVRRSRR